MVVNEPGSGSSSDGESEQGIDRSLERTASLLHLGEQKPPLERGEQSNGEVVRVDTGRELPVGMKGSESIGDGGSPLIEPSCDERSGLGITLGELTGKRAKRQPPLPLVRFAAMSTMFRQVSTPFVLLSACRLRLTMPSAW